MGVAEATRSMPVTASAAAWRSASVDLAVVADHEDRGRRQRAGRERLLHQLEALDRLDGLLEEVRRRVVHLPREQPERARDEHERREGEGRAGALEDLVADPPPHALAGDPLRVGVVLHRPGARPEPLAAEDREQRRQQRQPGEHAGEDADRRHGPERGRELRVGEGEGEHRQGDGQPRGEDRGPGAAHGARHRVVLVLDPVELLAVARHQEQAVVGRDPEHQDDQDRGAVRGDGRAGVGVEVDERGRHRVREEDDDERGQRHQHGAVDRPEQEQHEQRRHDQEPHVQLAEDLLGVDREPEVTGEDDSHPVGLVAGRVAHRLAPVGGVLEVGGDDERGERQTAVGGDGGRSLGSGRLRSRHRSRPPAAPVSGNGVIGDGSISGSSSSGSASTASASSAIFCLSASVSPPSRW